VSPIRSENGFGSSSAVPGATAAGAGKDGDRSGGSAAAGGTGGAAGSDSAPGEDASGGGAAGAAATGIRGTGSAAITPSRSRAYLLLLLALVVAGGLGFAGRYVARRR